MGMGEHRKHFGHAHLACGIDASLLVHADLHRLQRHLWLPWCRHWTNDVALGVGDHCPNGAELNSEIEHQTARDSTTGPEKPLGQRGAVMADTVGAAQTSD